VSVSRPTPPRCGPVRVEARHNAGTRAGGDLYEVIHSPFGVRAIIGDVAGHGPAAVELAEEIMSGFGELALHETSIAGIAFRIDAFLSIRADELPDPFATAILVQITPNGSYADVISCGHPAPVVLRYGRMPNECDLSPALPLGLQELEDGWYEATWLPLQPGDALLLASGGIARAEDKSGRLYPLVERAAQLTTFDPSEFLDRLEVDLIEHVGGELCDDLTLLYLRPDRVPAGDSPTPHLRIPALGPEWPDRPL